MSARFIKLFARPIITEKGLGVEKRRSIRWCLKCLRARPRRRLRKRLQQIFKVKVDAVRNRQFSRQDAPPRSQSEGYRRDWKKPT